MDVDASWDKEEFICDTQNKLFLMSEAFTSCLFGPGCYCEGFGSAIKHLTRGYPYVAISSPQVRIIISFFIGNTNSGTSLYFILVEYLAQGATDQEFGAPEHI